MFQNTRQLIVKVTRGCNLRCSYCYVFDKGEYQGEVMSLDTFKHLLHRFFSETQFGTLNQPEDNDGRQQSRQDVLSVVFHGGEPLSIGKEKIMQFSRVAHQLARDYNKVIQLGVQTNGTLIDDDWISIFNKYKIMPGLSFDGFESSDDERATGKKLLDIILKLKTHELINGVLMVVHKNNYDKIEENFSILRSIGLSHVKMNRGVDVTSEVSKDYECNQKQLLEASKQAMHFMWEHPDFEESNLRGIMASFIRQDAKAHIGTGEDHYAHCYTRYCGAGKALIEIEPDGEIQFCGRNSVRSKLTSPGNIFKRDVLELQNARDMLEFHKYKLDSIIENKCNLCPAQAICDGGCISFSNQKYGVPKIDSMTCGYFKPLHKYLSLNREKILRYFGDDVPRMKNSHFYL